MENLKELLKIKMKEIADGITPEDRADGVKNIPISNPTLGRYLNGDVKKIATAILIIAFYTPRIEKKIKKINN